MRDRFYQGLEEGYTRRFLEDEEWHHEAPAEDATAEAEADLQEWMEDIHKQSCQPSW